MKLQYAVRVTGDAETQSFDNAFSQVPLHPLGDVSLWSVGLQFFLPQVHSVYWTAVFRLNRGLLLFAALLLLNGCYVDEDSQRASPKRQGLESPWSDAQAPDDLMALADDLQAFLETTGRMPNTLSELDRANIATGGPYAKRAYAYDSRGSVRLKDGWRIIAVDDHLRHMGSLWCLVRPPVLVGGTTTFRCARVPLPELEAASMRASATAPASVQP